MRIDYEEFADKHIDAFWNWVEDNYRTGGFDVGGNVWDPDVYYSNEYFKEFYEYYKEEKLDEA